MKGTVPWILAFLAVTPCAAHFDQTATIADYEQALRGAMSQASPSALALRDRLLRFTPLGSSPEKVRYVITNTLHMSPNPYEKNYYTARTAAVDPLHPNDDFYVAGSIGIRYAETMSFWMTGTDTDVIWYFNERDRLISIVVWEHTTGL